MSHPVPHLPCSRRLVALTTILIVCAVGVAAPAAADIALRSDVLGAAGGVAGAGSSYLGWTLGQPLVSRSGSSGLLESAGFWHGRLAPLVAVDPVRFPTAMPASFGLLPNVPNPFRGRTTIRFAVPAASGSARIDLRVYDVAGRLVRALGPVTRAPGWHSVEWDGRDDGGGPARSGIYFCQMSAGRFQATRRILLIR